MKVVQINAYCGKGSTGKICVALSEVMTANGIENYILYTQGKYEHENFKNYNMGTAYTMFQSLKSKILGNNGFNCQHETKKLIQEIECIKPNLVHLHNLHAQNCNLEMLLNYLREKKIKIMWTFHDCWLITGYCMYFDIVGCKKWKSGCGTCPQRKKYSWLFDRSNQMWKKKENIFRNLDLTIITPSVWLENVVKESFLKSYPVFTIRNGIDLNCFKPIESDFKEKNGLLGKYIVLGVADIWDKRKGLDTFIKLSEELDDRYKIIMVGVDEKTERLLPKNILAIKRTENQEELVKVYSAADVFANPTIDEVFGLVNVEAIACGTPVVMYNTGGSPECIDELSGEIVEKYNFNELVATIRKICEEKIFSQGNCIKRASLFANEVVYEKYLEIYNRLLLG